MITGPFPGYNFLIALLSSSSSLASTLATIASVALGGFSACSGLEASLDTEDYREGGRNETVLKFPTRVTWSPIRLQRGVALGDELWNWHQTFVKGKGERKDAVIALLNDLQIPVKVWIVHRGLPSKWTGPSLDASQSRIAIEELDIVHEGLELFSLGTAAASVVGAIG